jgi:hypothetical protein
VFSSGELTAVEGEWTVPTLDCNATPDGSEATWVGIGGASDTAGDLLQSGTIDSCVNGAQQDYAWWEEYPEIPSVAYRDFPVSPGDTMVGEVYLSDEGYWQTVVQDLNTGREAISVVGVGWGVFETASSTLLSDQGSSVGLGYSGGTSAEWIVEAFFENGSQVTLADYGTVTFTDIATSLASWYLTAANGVELVQGNSVISTPSAPNSSGFSVSYTG